MCADVRGEPFGRGFLVAEPNLRASATERKLTELDGGTTFIFHLGRVAQLGAHLPCKQGVEGSNPSMSMMRCGEAVYPAWLITTRTSVRIRPPLSELEGGTMLRKTNTIGSTEPNRESDRGSAHPYLSGRGIV